MTTAATQPSASGSRAASAWTRLLAAESARWTYRRTVCVPVAVAGARGDELGVHCLRRSRGAWRRGGHRIEVLLGGCSARRRGGLPHWHRRAPVVICFRLL